MLSHRPFQVRPRPRRRSRRRLPARVVAGLTAMLAVLAAWSAPSQAQEAGSVVAPDSAEQAGRNRGRVHTPPVDAPVLDGFRPPAQPYGPGNRGLEYDTDPGDPVKASAAGEVVFAGVVAGARHVTVRHADGIRTSYSFLDRVEVVVGQQVAASQTLGIAGDRLHFGAREDDAYFDPATLFSGPTRVEVELVPFEVPPGSTADQERAALLMSAIGSTGFGGGFGLDLPSFGDLASWTWRRVPLWNHYAGAHPVARALTAGAAIVDRLASSEPCSDGPPPTRPVAGDRRVAILVGGLGSSSGSASIDRLRTDELGYGPQDTVRFSYAGGQTPDGGADLAGVQATAYASADTQGDLEESARRLADLVEDAVAARPEAIVDLYAHSMGGVVTRLALDEMERRGVDLDRLGLVATFGTPHQGADLATAVAAGNTSLPGALALDAATVAMGTGIDPDSPAVAQLAETSPTVASLRERGVPEGVDLVSIGASGDVVVTAPNTVIPGARNVTVGLTGRQVHGDLVAADETTAEVARALAGEPPRCEDPAEVVHEELTGQAISWTEDLAGLALMGPGG